MIEPRAVCYKTPINMRLSESSLADLVSQSGHKLDSGDLFIFSNKKRDQCKMVWHDGRSYNMLDKQLAVGLFKSEPELRIGQKVLESLLSGGFAGPQQLLHVLRGAVEGSNIIHIDAARDRRLPK